MHLPPYSRATIRAAPPSMPTSRHVGRVDYCLCDQPFGDQVAIPLGPTETSGLFGCRPCLKRLVAQARRTSYAALTQDAEEARAASVAWMQARDKHMAELDDVRRAAEAVTLLAADSEAEPLRIAWLLISLESAYTWATDNAPEPPAPADESDSELKDSDFHLSLEMISAREAVANRLAYHLINEATPADPDMCGEFECPEDCTGRHDCDHIDCGPDAIFEDLRERGIVVERTETGSSLRRMPPPGTSMDPEFSRMSEELPALLTHLGVDLEDPEALLSAAAVGLVAEAWRDGPLDAIHASGNGPSDGEIFAQSVDLYRRARAALLAAKRRSHALFAFQAVAADLDLPWAGGSHFTLRACGEPTDDFVQHLDGRVWYTSKIVKEHGWQTALLYRAVPGVLKGGTHFGMPRWPEVVATALERLAELDRSDAPTALTDLAAVETALEAPDRLGRTPDWLCHKVL
ncbi:hypothetical protein I3J15_21245 [Streptomyces clavuligerus]|nr:hypothetical protein I3J15_21245 [Streptomyces clavuligerus]